MTPYLLFDGEVGPGEKEIIADECCFHAFEYSSIHILVLGVPLPRDDQERC
jgi:hypothetical protein